MPSPAGTRQEGNTLLAAKKHCRDAGADEADAVGDGCKHPGSRQA
jgi:hypothetical protein